MTKEVEDIIKNKAFTELTVDERQRVGELAKNEEEYSEMQWFLLTATSAFESSKVTASPKMKNRVMEHLTNVGEKKGFWLNSVGVFMLPKGEPLFKKPLVQLGLAAALLVGFLAYYNQTIPENTLALNEAEQEEIFLNDPAGPITDSTVKNSSEEVQEQEMEMNGDLSENPKIMNLNDEVAIGQYKDAVQAEPSMSLVEDDVSIPVPENSEFGNGIAAALAEERSKVNSNKRQEMRADVVKKEDFDLEKQMEVLEGEEVVARETFVSAPEIASEELFARGSSYASDAQDQIIPKSLHIERTKELNQLFFIVK